MAVGSETAPDAGGSESPHFVVDTDALNQVAFILTSHDRWMTDDPALARAAEAVRQTQRALPPGGEATPEFASAVERLLEIGMAELARIGDGEGAELAEAVRASVESGLLDQGPENARALVAYYYEADSPGP